jgi:hypothetical protein
MARVWCEPLAIDEKTATDPDIDALVKRIFALKPDAKARGHCRVGKDGRGRMVAKGQRRQALRASGIENDPDKTLLTGSCVT